MPEVKFNLTKTQMTKLAEAHKKQISVTLQLNKTHISPTGIPLILTDTEYRKIQSGQTHHITISASRVKKGGFLPALIGALPIIASIIGGISGLSGIASNIKDMATGKGCGCRKGKGFISDLGIPVISPLAKIIGLGKRKPRRGKALYLAP